MIRRFLLLLPLICCAQSAFAANHFVVRSCANNGNGTSYSCAASPGGAGAFNAIPGTLVRGDVYYLADGNYGGYTFNTAASGTTTVELRKAQSYDFGGGAGWNPATMGSGQAIFSGGTGTFLMTAPWVILNGNGLQTAPGCGGAPGTTVAGSPPTPTDCGIKVQNTCSGGSDSCDATIYPQSGSGNYVIKYVELLGNGNNDSDRMELYGGNGGGSGLTISHMYAHNAGCVYIQQAGNNSTVSFSYFWGTEVVSGGPCHGQAEFEGGGTSGGVRHDNVYRDITGTAIWTFALPPGTANNWQYYNNVVFFSFPQASWGPSITDAVLDCINTGVVCTNMTFVQNTIINCPSTGSLGQSHCGVNAESGGSYTIENNLWYGNSSGSINSMGGGTVTENFNSFINSPSSAGSGAQDVKTSSGSPNPFVNWPGSNFNLASENALWNNRTSLGAPFTVDRNGNVFTSDRGAFQFVIPTLVKGCVVGNEANTASITTPSCVNAAGNFLIITTTAVRPFSTLTLTDTVGDTFVNANPSIFPFHDVTQDGDVYVWYVASARGGSPNTFTTVPTSGNSALEIHVSEWTGMNSWVPDQTSVANGATGGAAFNSGAKTPIKNGELIFGYTFPLGNSTPGAGFTGITFVNGDWDEYLVQASAASIAATFTSDNNGTWLALMQTFMPNSGGGSPSVSLSPTSLSFGNQLLTTPTSSQNITLTNTGTATLTITSIALTGTNPSEYAIFSNTCGASLGAGLNCVVGTTFTPTVLGARVANLTFTTNAATSPDNAALTGTGTATVFGIGSITIQGNVTIKP